MVVARVTLNLPNCFALKCRCGYELGSDDGILGGVSGVLVSVSRVLASVSDDLA